MNIIDPLGIYLMTFLSRSSIDSIFGKSSFATTALNKSPGVFWCLFGVGGRGGGGGHFI